MSLATTYPEVPHTMMAAAQNACVRQRVWHTSLVLYHGEWNMAMSHGVAAPSTLARSSATGTNSLARSSATGTNSCSAEGCAHLSPSPHTQWIPFGWQRGAPGRGPRAYRREESGDHCTVKIGEVFRGGLFSWQAVPRGEIGLCEGLGSG